MTPADGTVGGAASPSTEGADYTERLVALTTRRWKQALDVQRPYRWNLRRMSLGRVLDVGCGLGRNLRNLGPDAVGVDHNAASVAVARESGLTAYTPEDFLASPDAREGAFDSMLLAHVAEHMPATELLSLVRAYSPFLTPRRRVVMITPQERGYATDPTHVRFVGFAEQEATARELGASVELRRSFPFPRLVGRVFPYNEFVVDLHGVR